MKLTYHSVSRNKITRLFIFFILCLLFFSSCSNKQEDLIYIDALEDIERSSTQSERLATEENSEITDNRNDESNFEDDIDDIGTIVYSDIPIDITTIELLEYISFVEPNTDSNGIFFKDYFVVTNKARVHIYGLVEGVLDSIITYDKDISFREGIHIINDELWLSNYKPSTSYDFFSGIGLIDLENLSIKDILEDITEEKQTPLNGVSVINDTILLDTIDSIILYEPNDNLVIKYTANNLNSGVWRKIGSSLVRLEGRKISVITEDYDYEQIKIDGIDNDIKYISELSDSILLVTSNSLIKVDENYQLIDSKTFNSQDFRFQYDQNGILWAYNNEGFYKMMSWQSIENQNLTFKLENENRYFQKIIAYNNGIIALSDGSLLCYDRISGINLIESSEYLVNVVTYETELYAISDKSVYKMINSNVP